MKVVGHNDAEQARAVASFIIPSWAELSLLALASTILLVAANWHRIWLAISNSSQLGSATASQTLQPQIDYVNSIFHQEIFGQLAVTLTWCLVGCLVYMGIWSLQRFLRRVKDEVDESGYTGATKKKNYWFVRVGQYLYFACSAFLFLLFLVVFLVIVVPFASGMADATISGRLFLSSYAYLALGIFLVMCSLFCLSRLWRGAHYAFKATFSPLD